MRAPVSNTKSTYKPQGTFQLRPGSPLNHLKNAIGNLLNPFGPKYGNGYKVTRTPSPKPNPALDNLRKLTQALQDPNSQASRDYSSRYNVATGMHDLPTSPTNPIPGVTNWGQIRAAQTEASRQYKAGLVPKPAAAPRVNSTSRARQAVKGVPAAPHVMSSHPTPTSFRPLPNNPAPKFFGTPVGGSSAGRSSSVGGGGGAVAGGGIDPFTGKATAAVDAELGPQTNALQRQLDTLNSAHSSQVAEANARQARAQQDLSILYSHLGNFTKGLQGVQDTNYGTTEKTVGDNYAQLQQQLAQNFGARTADTNNELSRLGIQAVSPEATASLGRDQTFLQGLANVNATNAHSNLEGQRSGFDSLFQMMQGNGATEGVVQRGQSARDAAKVLAALNQAYNTNNTDLMGRKSDIQATRGTKIQQMVDALKQQDAASRQAAETAAFNRELAMSKLGISQGQLTLAQQKALSQAGLTQAQIAHLANSDTVAQQNANTNAARAKAAAAAAAAKAAGGGAYKPPTGLDGAESVLKSLIPGANQQNALNELRTLINATYADDLTPFGKPGQTGAGKPSPSDPITMAHLNTWFKNASAAPAAGAKPTGATGMTKADYDAIVRALTAYANKIGHA